tara:strand:- start:120 stop:275 length:156 start_codon:yes stop_codon:yes gene_type:complete
MAPLLFHRQYLNPHKESTLNGHIFDWKHSSQDIIQAASSRKSAKTYALTED